MTKYASRFLILIAVALAIACRSKEATDATTVKFEQLDVPSQALLKSFQTRILSEAYGKSIGADTAYIESGNFKRILINQFLIPTGSVEWWSFCSKESRTFREGYNCVQRRASSTTLATSRIHTPISGFGESPKMWVLRAA